MLTLLLTLLAFLPIALTFPLGSRTDLTSLSSLSSSNFETLVQALSSSCTVSSIAVPLANQSTLAVPNGQTTSIVTVGRGVQNYTCTSNAWVSTGALANLYDVSCLFSMTAGRIDPSTLSSLLPKIAYSTLSYPNPSSLPAKLQHLFTDTPGSTTTGAISPEFISSSNHVIASKTASLSDTINPSTNVAWLQHTAITGQGTLADSVYRINTVNGQPPSSCVSEGENLSVQYAASYWFTA